MHSVDREVTQQVTLTIRARDSSTPFLSNTTSLVITITDVNDNAPQFNQTHYFVSIPEDLTPGGLVLKVSAMDPDISNNSIIDYNVIEPADVFKINIGTGEMTTRILLDHETTSFYEVLVQACDRGNPVQLCSNATVIVDVTDVNDVTPTFDYDSYCVDVCSDMHNQTVIAQLVAADGDSGENGRVHYSISADSSNGLFAINENTGRIRLATTLSSTNNGEYTLTVVGMDGGASPRSSSATLQVTIRDCSSSVLSFPMSFYTATIFENTSAPAILVNVSADGGSSPISYSLQLASVDQPFNITEMVSIAEMFHQ